MGRENIQLTILSEIVYKIKRNVLKEDAKPSN
jgi:hypothetical protein